MTTRKLSHNNEIIHQTCLSMKALLSRCPKHIEYWDMGSLYIFPSTYVSLKNDCKSISCVHVITVKRIYFTNVKLSCSKTSSL